MIRIPASVVLSIVGALALLSGCAILTRQGEVALSAGRYAEAAARFEEALAREPESVDARIGLGVARYRLGALDDAERVFAEVLTRAPDLPIAHLYLGLSALRRGQDAPAAERLRRYAQLGVAPRLADHIERALRALASGPVTDLLREYVATAIEEQSAWAGEVATAGEALAASERRRITDDRTLLLLGRACRCR